MHKQERLTFKSPDELLKIFQNIMHWVQRISFLLVDLELLLVFGLANSIISGKTPMIYDGSWSEYGLKNK